MSRDEKSTPGGAGDTGGGRTGDDPLDAFRDDKADREQDAEGQEALSRPEDLSPGQRRIVDDEAQGG
jgi:hypothetical protein